MTVVSNDPSWWPTINFDILISYWLVATAFVVVYDWILTLPQEIDLIWTQRWSLMTVLYLVIHYVGIPFSIASILEITTFASLTDAAPHNDSIGNIIIYAVNGTNVIVTAMLGVIMIARLHAMYQRSRRMLIFLVIIFLAVNITCGVITIIGLKHDSVSEEFILSGIHMCGDGYEGDTQLLISMVWMLNTVWEVLALCLSIWIAAKHFRDLRRLGPLTGSTIGDCFKVLLESHVLYFASFAGVSCLQLVNLSPEVQSSNSAAAEILDGVMEILWSVQMFVVGPRLILSVRQYHAKLVAGSDAETSMNSIVFQERVHVQTSSTV
ncbi:uncharacterized protein HD556DRAFT_1452872 [Suillus plorans]|uniref:DUF6533 domain-containing protein n=1 Tax=Suillus plorans TaxID=116603 RepID=A0A9P7E305_9AGAM|nr:uncharacterized protein HD556DRAFT_1452872 [Suillus plorans]KAG1810010.1 hypothetical protein HD556DRAFT_1452872 [Suillus plorans]